MSHREMENTEDYKNTTLIGTEALLRVEQRSLFTSYIRHFLFKVFISKIIRKLYAIPLSFFVSSAPPWHHVYLRPRWTSVYLTFKALVFHSIFWKNLIKGIERLAHDVRMPRTSCVDALHILCGWCITLMNEVHSHTYKAYKGLTINQLHESFVLICL